MNEYREAKRRVRQGRRSRRGGRMADARLIRDQVVEMLDLSLSRRLGFIRVLVLGEAVIAGLTWFGMSMTGPLGGIAVGAMALVVATCYPAYARARTGWWPAARWALWYIDTPRAPAPGVEHMREARMRAMAHARRMPGAVLLRTIRAHPLGWPTSAMALLAMMLMQLGSRSTGYGFSDYLSWLIVLIWLGWCWMYFWTSHTLLPLLAMDNVLRERDAQTEEVIEE